MIRSGPPPRFFSVVYRRLFPGRLGAEVCRDLETEYAKRLGRAGPIPAWWWYAAHAARPGTWVLAIKLRRAHVGIAASASRRTSRRGKARHTAWVSTLDFKLGVRMLAKSPGLTVIGGLGMAVAIAIGAGSFTFIYSLMDPTLPLEDGDRIVQIQNWDLERNNPNRQVLHDLVTWREDLETIEDVGGFRTVVRNLITTDGTPEPVNVAEMSAAGFRLARVNALMGRHLLPADERANAPPVVVVGYEVWQRRFAGEPNILGRTIQLGLTPHTVVGVMPDEFLFPVNHRLWIPLRVDPTEYERGDGPGLTVFGRLAGTFALDEARAEVTAVGQRMAAAFPASNEFLRPMVLPYAFPFFDIDNAETVWGFHLIQVLVSLLLVVVGVNVAILTYARTAMRRGEIAVRTALGANRGRVVAQLFVEAFVLSGVSAALGLGLAAVGIWQVNAFIAVVASSQIPFWLDIDLSLGTVLYVAGLSALAAVIVGVIPAVKATGSGVHAGLQQLGSGATGMRLGGTWTVLIVGQVAVAVAGLPMAVFAAGEFMRYGVAAPAFPAEEFLTARLGMDASTSSHDDPAADGRDFESIYGDRFVELARRLRSEPELTAVTFAAHVPGEEPQASVEVERPGTSTDEAAARHYMRVGRVDLHYFDALGVPILTGRAFHRGDLDSASTAVIADREFVDRVLGGGNALGRRVRYAGGYRAGGVERMPQGVERDRWYEIVGVVPSFAKVGEPGAAVATLYHPADPHAIYPAVLALRMRNEAPVAFVGRVREVTAALDPNLRLNRTNALDRIMREDQNAMRMTALGIGLATLSVVLLSAAGIYALMSFTVTRRRREIGIRTALGAQPRRLLQSIFIRAATQLGAGVVIGTGTAALLNNLSGGEMVGDGLFVLPGVALLMTVVGLVAAAGPARRGLRIQPTEALREG